jgi:Zn-dependent protease with chaperone function
MKRLFAAPAAVLAGALMLGPVTMPVEAQTPQIRRTPSSFNIFSVEQDVELGRQSAVEAEKQLPLLNDAVTNRYLNRIIQRLAAQAPGAKYPYQIKAVNATEVNAFALPGGPMYVNRGLITVSKTEAELAGVLAHEMSHVALRHGTAQASKAYMGQAGLSLLGGLLGKRGGTTSQIVNALGGFGLNAVFMKFSRSDELEADALGAELMSKAGYDPMAMATMFATLRAEQGRDPSKLERFFSSHPPPADREARIRTLASSLGGTRSLEVVGDFSTIRQRVGGTAVAAGQIPQWQTATGEIVTAPSGNVQINVPAPSSRFARFTHPQGFFTVDHPNNWRTYPSGFAVSMAPDGGVVEHTSGQPHMLYGMIFNHYVPFDGETDRWTQSLQRNYAPFEDRTRPRGTLEDATDDLIRQVLGTNTYLTARTNSAQSLTIDGAQGYSVILNGISPVTGEVERVTVYTRLLTDDHVLYALCITPGRTSTVVERSCSQVMNTLRVNDEAAHRAERTRLRSLRPPQ